MKPTEALSVVVEAAFGDDPLDTSPTYVDITADVDSWWINRGRPSPLVQFGAGRSGFKLHDTTGDYDPGNGSGLYAGDLVENLHYRIKATPNATIDTLCHGYVDTWDPTFRDPDIEEVTVTGTDLWKFIQRFRGKGPDTDGNWAAGLTSDRVTDVLDQAGIVAKFRSIDPGSFTMTARANLDMGVIINGASELQLAAESEAPWAAAFATSDGQIRFDARSSIATNSRITTAQATLSKVAGDVATAMNPGELGFGWFDGLARPRAEATLADGTVIDAVDATAVDDYGPQTYAPNLSQLDPGLTGAQANLTAAIVMYASERYGPKRAARIVPLDTSSPAEDLLNLELRDRVTVKHETPNGRTINEEAHVQAINIVGDSEGRITVALTLAAAAFIDDLNPAGWLIWDQGKWDQEHWSY